MDISQEKSSYKQIIKAAGIFGGVRVIDILIRIIRMKIVAVLLGTTGVGLIGLYRSILDLFRNATGFGLQFSSVKEIARANGKNDNNDVSKIIVILRRWVWLTGILGVILVITFSKQISKYTFGDEAYSFEVSAISIVLLFTAITGGQLALLQGLRKVKLMAKAQIWGLLISFVITTPLYWLYGLEAIVPVFIISSAIVLLFSWIYSNKVSVQPIKIGLGETFSGGLEMVRLGFFMVISTVLSIGSLYLLRMIILQNSGIDAVGLFQCAYAITTLYLAAVLQAMGTDYFPRLSGVSHNNDKVVTLVNEQTEIVILLAGPLVIGMLSFIDWVVIILYSSEFTQASIILHWMLVGTLLKVISWPLGYIMLAKGKGMIYLGSQIIGKITLITFVYLLWNNYEIEVLGMGYLLMFIIYTITVYLIANYLSGFVWTDSCKRIGIIFVILTLAAFLNTKYSDAPIITALIGIFLLFVSSIYSLYELNKVVDIKSIFKKVVSK